ncbi:MAG TPA: DNA repair protein RadC [Proteobacteria bacterium]|nr:DNA repair protein RadC [Pseudomonadota bacterium]
MKRKKAILMSNNERQPEMRELGVLRSFIGHRAAEAVLTRYSMAELLRADRKSLMEVRFMGPSKANAILALPRLLDLVSVPRTGGRVISCSRDIFELFRFSAGIREQEHFVVLALNSRNRIIYEETTAVGSVNTVHVSPADILKPAIRHAAASIICMHNHPSGDPAPSADDRSLTDRIARASILMGIRFLDHLVITVSSYYSFSDSGEI